MMKNQIYTRSANTPKILFDRQVLGLDQIILRNRFQERFLKSLELEKELIGHNGCVNCLEWSEDGRLLASASDDYKVILWDPFKHKKNLEIVTPHRGNIFTVKFLPKSNNSRLATGAGDSHLFVFDVNRPENPIWKCECHYLRVKRIAVAPEISDVFWSSSEDGQVFQFDIREPHTCREKDKIVLVDLNNHKPHVENYLEAKCIAINPTRSHLLAIGANDIFTRVYDRRMITLNSLKLDDRLNSSNRRAARQMNSPDYQDNLTKACVQYYCPGHLNLNVTENSNKTATYLTFSPDGNELLVNYGAEQIYLFDMNNAEQPTILNLPKLPAAPSNTPKPVKEQIDSIKRLGNDFLENEKYLQAIIQYTEAIAIDPNISTLYLNRATAFMRRKWYGDVYEALRDCHSALKLDPFYVKAHFRLSRALLELNQLQLANDCLQELKKRFPSHETNHGVLMLEQDINSALMNRNSTSSGPERNTQDFSDSELYWRANAKDFKDRFIGHCNTKTDIKEANFFGHNGNYIAAGSDDGNFFIWERPTNKVIEVFNADKAIVNCVQPHPFHCLIATSGIDHEIRLWSPQPEVEKSLSRRAKYIDTVIQENQNHMHNDFFEFSGEGTVCRAS